MSGNEETKEVHAIVTGVVQGVGFRASTLRIALSLQLKGFVRNQKDGSVEIFVQGSASQLALFFDRLKKETAGIIEHIAVSDHTVVHIFDDFHIAR
jgi:acylphosphatase